MMPLLLVSCFIIVDYNNARMKLNKILVSDIMTERAADQL